MGEDAPRALAAAAEPVEPPGRNQPVMVQRRRVLDRKHEPLGPAALDRRLEMRCQDVLHAHPRVRQQPVGRLLLGPAGEDLRQRLSEMLLPCRAHPDKAPPHPPVGVGAAPVFALGPVPAAGQRVGPAQDPLRLPAQPPPPARRQRLEPDGAAHARTPPGGQLRAAPPPRGPVAQPGLPRPGEGLRQHRAHAVGRLPVVGDALRRQAKGPGCQPPHPDAGKQQEPVVAHHKADVGHAGVGRPADRTVAGAELHPGRGEADAAQHTMPFRTDPVAELGARRTAPPLGMVRPDHCLPAAAVLRIRHRFKRQGPELAERAGQLPVGEVRAGTRSRTGRGRQRLRKPQARLHGQTGQEPAGRGKARPAGMVAPILPLAELAGQGGPRQAAVPAGGAEPLHRLR